MCAVSMVGDHYSNKWRDYRITPLVPQVVGVPQTPTIGQIVTNIPVISREEFDTLKREVAEMKELLLRAKEYDKKTGQPDCEMEEKVALLKKVADLVGISLDDVFGKS